MFLARSLSKSPLLKGPLDLSRRRLCTSVLAAAAASLLPSPLKASLEKLARESARESDVRTLAFHNTHTNESLEAPYWVSGRYQESGLTAIDWILRDHRTGDVARIDPKLLDLLHLLREQAAGVGSPAVYEVSRASARRARTRCSGTARAPSRGTACTSRAWRPTCGWPQCRSGRSTRRRST